MNSNIVKNILVGVSAAAIIVLSLIKNPFNMIGMIIAIASIILLMLLLFLYRKEDDLTSKIDIYLLLLVTGITGGKFGTLISGYNAYTASNALGNIKGLGFLFIGLAIAGTVVVSKLFKKVELVKRLFSIIAITFALAYTMGGILSVYDYFILGAIICFYLFTATLNDIGKPAKAFKRNYWVTLVTMTLFLIRKLIFPAYSYSAGSLLGTLNFKILPFYFVGAIILISVVVIGLDAKSDVEKKISKDMILFGGLASLAVVAKCSVYFHFYYSWIAILFGAFILIAIAFRHAANIKSHVIWKLEKKNWQSNPFFFMIFVELALGFVVSQICYGHVYFAGALFISYFIITVIPKAFKNGWRSDVAKSLGYIFSIALLACSRVITVGYSLKKILLISAIFVFTAFMLYFIDHNNRVGHNDYKEAKVMVIVVYALLMIVPVYKGGSKVKIEAEEKDSLVSNYVISSTELSVKAKADGKDNDVESVKYVFSDNFSYDRSRVVEVDDDEFTVDIKDDHLIVWVTDSNGMETKKDFWFENYYNMNTDVGGNFVERIENRDPIKSGQNYSIYNKHFYDGIESAAWVDYDADGLEAGKYYSDVSRLTFFIDVMQGVSEEIYYAYYYSYDQDFDDFDLGSPVYSYSVSPKDNSYDLVLRSNINPGYYVLVVASDEDSVEDPYLLARASIYENDAPKEEAEILDDQNRTYINSLPNTLATYVEGYISVDTSLYETSYSELDDYINGGLSDMSDWSEDDLEADSVCGYGPVAFKFYDEICVSMVYAYSSGSFDLETLRDIYARRLGACDTEIYDAAGNLVRCSWSVSDMNVYLYLGNTDHICYVEFESADSVIED